MCPFHSVAVKLMREFDDVQISYMLRECNHRDDHMDNVRSGSKLLIDIEGRVIAIKERSLPSIQKRGLFVEACTILMEDED